MTINSQNLTFGEWLTACGISPNNYQNLPPQVQSRLRDAWQEGIGASLPDFIRSTARSKP